MTFRAKLLLACVPLALAPLAFFGWRAREGVTSRLDAQYRARVEALAGIIAEDIQRESAAIAGRLDRLAEAMAADNRLRLALRRGGGADDTDRAYLLDYAGRAMRVAGLDLLRVQDEDGRVLSSGHFRNEYDAVDPTLPAALRRAGDRAVLATVPTAAGPVLVLARTTRVRVGTETLTLVGGTAVDRRFIDRLTGGTGLGVSLAVPRGVGAGAGTGVGVGSSVGTGSGAGTDSGTGAGADPGLGPDSVVLRSGGAGDVAFEDASRAGTDAPMAGDAGSESVPPAAGGRPVTGTASSHAGISQGYVREVAVPFAGGHRDGVARFVVRASTAPLDALRRDMDRWLLATLAGAGALALLLAVTVSARIGRPLAELARNAGRVDLDRLDVGFSTGRADEIGDLSRVLDRMIHRLRVSAARLREAERRATIGEIARQVNHDIRNGLIPIRNVVNHLTELARERPHALPEVFLDRRGTLESSVDYLRSLAGDYARLSPKLDARPCDLNAIAREVVREAGRGAGGHAVEPRPTAGSEHGHRAAGARAAEPRRTTGSGKERVGTRVLADLTPGLPPVHADPVALRRVVENLVVNAVESLEGGGGRVVVSTRLAPHGDSPDPTVDPPRVLLHVADTGRGMSTQERARIFDDFYTTKPDGTGLGLSIVRRLVNDMGGRIAVESTPGEGTRFTVELAPATGSGAEDGATHEPAPGPEPRPGARAGRQARASGDGASNPDPGPAARRRSPDAERAPTTRRTPEELP